MGAELPCHQPGAEKMGIPVRKMQGVYQTISERIEMSVVKIGEGIWLDPELICGVIYTYQRGYYTNSIGLEVMGRLPDPKSVSVLLSTGSGLNFEDEDDAKTVRDWWEENKP